MNIRKLSRKEIFSSLAVCVPTIKSQYYSLQVLLDEQRRKDSNDPFDEDLKRLEKVNDSLASTIREIERTIQLMTPYCTACPPSKARICGSCNVI